MKLIPLLLVLTVATAAAEVPSLINYQGRLVGADGSAQSGQKTFLLEVFGAASGGSLLYREEVGNITLGEGGVYSFQFGGSGTSNAQITETIGTGGEAVLYQQVLSNLPVVAGSVSVNDGTYTWSQASGSSNEDDFSGSFSTNLNRITVNYFSGAPNDGRSIDVTYRYQAEGITGALSSGGEHWLQLTIDGDVQATRERVLAVPFALRAGVANKVAPTKKEVTPLFLKESLHSAIPTLGGAVSELGETVSGPLVIPASATGIKSLKLRADGIVLNQGQWLNPIVEIRRAKISEAEERIFGSGNNPPVPTVEMLWTANLNPTVRPVDNNATVTFGRPDPNSGGPTLISITFTRPLDLDGEYIHWVTFSRSNPRFSNGQITSYKFDLTK